MASHRSHSAPCLYTGKSGLQLRERICLKHFGQMVALSSCDWFWEMETRRLEPEIAGDLEAREEGAAVANGPGSGVFLLVFMFAFMFVEAGALAAEVSGSTGSAHRSRSDGADEAEEERYEDGAEVEQTDEESSDFLPASHASKLCGLFGVLTRKFHARPRSIFLVPSSTPASERSFTLKLQPSPGGGRSAHSMPGPIRAVTRDSFVEVRRNQGKRKQGNGNEGLGFGFRSSTLI
mmetsp:Transcript_4861/g.11582  ORF Transcript_4861/g.11582 Transcript_4861/m.11582 type:complete len:235 (-) Transcript_4861:1338-2042(-)